MTLPFFIKRENYFVRCRSHACQGLGASSVSVPWSFNNTIPYKLASVVEHFTYTFPVILNKCRIELVFNNRDYFIFLLFKWNSHVPPKSDLFTVEHFKFLYVIGKIIKTDRRSFLVNICPFFASRFGKGEKHDLLIIKESEGKPFPPQLAELSPLPIKPCLAIAINLYPIIIFILEFDLSFCFDIGKGIVVTPLFWIFRMSHDDNTVFSMPCGILRSRAFNIQFELVTPAHYFDLLIIQAHHAVFKKSASRISIDLIRA